MVRTWLVWFQIDFSLLNNRLLRAYYIFWIHQRCQAGSVQKAAVVPSATVWHNVTSDCCCCYVFNSLKTQLCLCVMRVTLPYLAPLVDSKLASGFTDSPLRDISFSANRKHLRDSPVISGITLQPKWLLSVQISVVTCKLGNAGWLPLH